MTAYIILANIGNRNIKYHHQGYPNDEIPKNVFLMKTQFLLEHSEEWDKVEITLLPVILNRYPESKLYLFTTFQKPPFVQDTYYEGLLIKSLLAKSHPLLRVDVVNMAGVKPNLEDELVIWYRRQIQFIRFQHPDAHFIMYDSGGTPQQKSALKSVIKFYFKTPIHLGVPKKYSLYQGHDDFQGGTIVEEIHKSASERLLQLTNIKLLIQHHNYTAAMQLAETLDNRNLLQILGYAVLRWDNMWIEIKRNYPVHRFAKAFKSLPEFKACVDYDDEKIAEQGASLNGLSVVGERGCRNLAAKGYAQMQDRHYSGAILTLHQLIEMYVGIVIESFTQYNVYSDYWKAGILIIEKIKRTYEKECLAALDFIPSSISFPPLVFFAEQIPDMHSSHRELLEAIRHTQSAFKSDVYPQKTKLDSLRNGVVHKGRGVTQEEFEVYRPLIEKIYGMFIEDRNPFKEINVLVERLM